MKTLFKSILLAVALCGGANADVYEASFDGGWFDPTQSGRGAMVDYIPQDGGNGAYFITLFTYDQAGAPLWLTVQASGREGTRLFRNAQVRSFRGGNFGVPFVAPAPDSGTVIGTATVDVANCNSLIIDFAPSAGTTLPTTRFSYRRLGNPNSGSSVCPFTQSFTTCPTGTTAVAGADRVCEIPAGVITSNLRLTNTASYVFTGRVMIGSPMQRSGALGASQATLTIEPGTVLRGSTTRSYIVVNPGSKILAEGTSTAPIIFTGATEVQSQSSQTEGTWGGLIIGGRAPLNTNCTGTGGAGSCAFETDSEVIWGGNLPNDNSGVLRYVQIRSAGGFIQPPTGDLNGLTLGGVGDGTTVEFVQAHDNTDDGFEMFGGTVNLRYIVASGNSDDSIDTDQGYVGKIQYAYVVLDASASADTNGIESDNGTATQNQDALPRTRPTLINATFDGRGFGLDGIRIRRGSGFVLQNVVVTGFPNSCINLIDAPTFLATAPAGQPTQVTSNGVAISGSVVSCTRNFFDRTTDPWLTSAFFAGQNSNTTGGDISGSLIRGRLPALNAPLLRSGFLAPTTGGFFQGQAIRGAFADGDWTVGWTTGLQN
jgi:hypothetical protein